MNYLRQLIGKTIDIEISGKNLFRGILIDASLDLIVIYKEQKYFYIPFVHVQNVKISSIQAGELEIDPEIAINEQTDSLSYRAMLENAKGRFVELYVTGKTTIHGYLTSILNDYFVFYSPVCKTIFISLDHVKWVIPYPLNLTPYSLGNHHFPVNPTTIPLSRTFEQQCKRLEGNLIVFDLGDHPNKIGLLEKVENHKLELKTANGETLLWNLRHLKAFHVPKLS
jgi:hypothetical protein